MQRFSYLIYTILTLCAAVLLDGCVGKPLNANALTGGGESRTWQLKEKRINNHVEAIEDPCEALTQLIYYKDGRMETLLWVHDATKNDDCQPVTLKGSYAIVRETDELVDTLTMGTSPPQQTIQRKKLFELTDKRMIFTLQRGMLTIEYTFVPVDK